MKKTNKLLIALCFGLIGFTLLAKPLKSADSNSKTEAGSPVTTCTADCDNQTISPQNLLSEIQSLQKTTASCELASSKHKLKDGKLTDYWAQEMVGADLLKEELEKTSPLPEDKHLVAVFDTPTGSHNIYVQNIISHEGPQAVLPALNSSQLKYFQTKWDSDYMETVEALSSPKENTVNEVQNVKPAGKESTVNKVQNVESSGNFPSFINNSMRWGGYIIEEGQSIYKSMSRMCPPSILVQAAGNDYMEGSPSLYPIESKFSKNFDSIIVGSLSPHGVVSEYSQEGEEVHILAPSDYYITSADNDGKYEKFSGTSGAAPLVTGSLAGFEWLSGYHPTAKEAKLLLEKTAIPTIHSVFEDPKKNGKGMLNAYKLGRVAQRLKDKCNDNHQCFTDEIKNPENYQFSVSQSVLDNVRSAFPKCSDSVEDVQETDCSFKKSAFKKLRQAVLLDTTNVELWKQLQCIYNQEGFSENASAVETTLWALSENLPDSDAIKDPSVRRIIEGSISGVARIGEGVLEILQTLATDKNTDEKVKREVADAAGVIGGSGGKEILQVLAQDTEGLQILQTLVTDKYTNAKVRINLALAARDIEGAGGEKLLKTLVIEDGWEARMNLALAAGDIEGTQGEELLNILVKDTPVNFRGQLVQRAGEKRESGGLQILQTLATDKDVGIRIDVAYAAGEIGGDGALQLLQTLAQDSSMEVRYRAIQGAIRIGGDGALQLLQTLAQDSSVEVRYRAIQGAIRIGGEGGLKILKPLTTDEDEMVRKGAIVGIGKIGGDGGKELLQILAEDSNEEVREMAAKEIIKLKESL